MSNSITTEHLSPRASLAAIGAIIQQRNLFGPVREQLKVAQKTVKYAPSDKLYDAFITILAGAHGLVEVNTRLRADPALQQAFGRTACAEQSVVQDTLDACNSENVTEFQTALTTIYRAHSQGYAHDYTTSYQLLDVDMSGLPCGKKAAFACKGYFAKQRNRRGRQLGRVLASTYHEIVVDQLFDGATQLNRALQPLITAAEDVLELDQARRSHTIVRVDAGGGSVDDLNWLLERGYTVLAKDYSSRRSAHLAASVTRWYADPKVGGREVGWVNVTPTQYARAVVRIAVRCRRANGQWGYGVLIGPPELAPLWRLLGGTGAPPSDGAERLLAYVYAYDARGGGVETTFRDDKQGLGLAKRSKKRFASQQIVMLLTTLAHNVIIWARSWMTPTHGKLSRYGLKRLVRDIFHISGRIICDALGHVVQIILNQAAPLVRELVAALQPLLRLAHIAITLGQT